MADFPIPVGFNETNPANIAKVLRELHSWLLRQPVVQLHRESGVLSLPLEVKPLMRTPRVIGVTARNDPDDNVAVEPGNPYWHFDSRRGVIVIEAIDGLTVGTKYTIDFTITGSRD